MLIKHCSVTKKDGILLNVHPLQLHTARPDLLNPKLLDEQHIALEDLLQEKAIGNIFSTQTIFDQFPAIHSVQQVAGIQRPCEDHQNMMDHALEQLLQVTMTMYGEKFLGPKLFPHLHPLGFGGWHPGCTIQFSDHVKMRQYDARGWFSRDRQYPFYKFDLMSKERSKAYATKTLTVALQVEKVTAEKVLSAEKGGDLYSSYEKELYSWVTSVLEGLGLTSLP